MSDCQRRAMRLILLSFLFVMILFAALVLTGEGSLFQPYALRPVGLK